MITNPRVRARLKRIFGVVHLVHDEWHGHMYVLPWEASRYSAEGWRKQP